MSETSFWRGRRVLVTGHTGFKGSWLSFWLARMGARVSGVALPPPTTPSLFDDAGVAARLESSRTIDVRDRAAVADALRAAAPEVVFHLAAQALVLPSYDDPVGTYGTNVMGTVHVLDAVRATPSVRAVVVVTSDKCYENRERAGGYAEDEPLGGFDPYSSSKAAAELVTAAYRRSFFADERVGVASARAGNVIGGGDWSPHRLVPDLLRGFAAGEAVTVRSPAAVRPWQHVLDPLAGYLTLARRLVDDPRTFGAAWNFGPDDEDVRTVGWIADRAAQLWGDGARWVHDRAPRAHEATLLQLDATRARTRLGWAPHWDVERALERTVRWQRAWLDARRGAGGSAAVQAAMEDDLTAWEAAAAPVGA